MILFRSVRLSAALFLAAALALAATPAVAADQALLDILLANKVITQEQYDQLMTRDQLTTQDILGPAAPAPATTPDSEASVPASVPAATADAKVDTDMDAAAERAVNKKLEGESGDRLVDRISKQVEENLPVKASYGDKGFRLESKDGNFQTNLQWRAQLRFTYPFVSDPRQVDDFTDDDNNSTFAARRLRMKIGGHGYRPWLKYYFEVDLQPSRDTDDDGSRTSARVIDWRIDVAKWDCASLRVGQWKVELNRERVDSSGRQQFVERSIVNRVFTIDRQVGIQLKGHLFKGTPADMRYWAGVFTGEGRGVVNDDDHMMYMGRLQWNFLGRDLPWRQTDIDYTDQPTGSLAFAGATHEGKCTRWSSSGCGRLDGFARPGDATDGQFEIDQMVQEFAFKYRGFSAQQEFHWKTIKDFDNGTKDDLEGAYAQAGYFFHYLFPIIPEPLEIAFRYAFVDEPNEIVRSITNRRQEYTTGLNWFFNGHNNKLTLDYSYLTLDDPQQGVDIGDSRVRVQWDVSF